MKSSDSSNLWTWERYQHTSPSDWPTHSENAFALSRQAERLRELDRAGLKQAQALEAQVEAMFAVRRR